jgi:hypothetical protein
MGTFSIEISIKRNARDVFAVLSDVRRMPLWYEAVKEVVALTPGVLGKGARYEIGRTHVDTLVTQLFKRGMGENLRQLSQLMETA